MKIDQFEFMKVFQFKYLDTVSIEKPDGQVGVKFSTIQFSIGFSYSIFTAFSAILAVVLVIIKN